MLAAKFIAVVHVDITGTELGARTAAGRHQDEIVLGEYAALEVATRRNSVTEGKVDESGFEPPVELLLLARPEGDGEPGAVATQVEEKALAEPAPQVELEPNVAHALASPWQRDLVARLVPELDHELGISLELEPRRGEIGSGFATMQKPLADLLLEAVEPRRDR